MEQELTNKRNYANIFKRITRYSLKPPSIILNINAPIPTGDPVVDPEGEWMKCDQLNGIITAGGLLESTPALLEELKDGEAQRALMRTLTQLGYQDFDQVMEVLRNNREQVLKLREFEIWMEGWQDNGNHEKARLLGKGVGLSFHEAVLNLKEQLGPHKTSDWRQWPDGTWHSYLCTFYDNEADARKGFG